jgi:cell wall-associated NlpC family hydrolase
MIKKVVTLLLLLSTVSFANTPNRHRVQALAPDAVATPSGIQPRMTAIDDTALPQLDMTPAMEAMVDEVETIREAADKRLTIADLLSAAKQHLGARYRHGSSGPSAFDCSGFTSYVFSRLGITLHRSSQEQHHQGEAVSQQRELQPGDLVFFGRRGKYVNHVGIVTDVATDGTFHFIHASTSRGVRIDSSTDDYWSPRFVGGRRIIGTNVNSYQS